MTARLAQGAENEMLGTAVKGRGPDGAHTQQGGWGGGGQRSPAARTAGSAPGTRWAEPVPRKCRLAAAGAAEPAAATAVRLSLGQGWADVGRRRGSPGAGEGGGEPAAGPAAPASD